MGITASFNKFWWKYVDRWSGVIALQGLAPYKLELDNSLYILTFQVVAFIAGFVSVISFLYLAWSI